MIKFIVNEQPSEKGIHHIHNASLGCADLPSLEDQILIGYFPIMSWLINGQE